MEAKYRLFRDIRHMKGKMKGGNTSKIITTVDNKVVEHTERQSIETIVAISNEKILSNRRR